MTFSKMYAARSYATHSLFCYDGPMMQGFQDIKALASSGYYNSQTMHRWAIIALSGIYSIHYGKYRALISKYIYVCVCAYACMCVCVWLCECELRIYVCVLLHVKDALAFTHFCMFVFMCQMPIRVK